MEKGQITSAWGEAKIVNQCNVKKRKTIQRNSQSNSAKVCKIVWKMNLKKKEKMFKYIT